MQRAIRDLCTVVTIGQAHDIVRRWGNRRYLVPMKVEAGDPLALTIGLDPARRLVEAFGGQTLDIPMERHALRRLRDEAIYRLRVEEKRSGADVALEFGLTRQHVDWIVERVRTRIEDVRPATTGG